jgi:hypothetical protein
LLAHVKESRVGARVEVFPEEHLQAVADVLGDTYGGLTGSEIGRLLALCGVDDPYPDLTKRFLQGGDGGGESS